MTDEKSVDLLKAQARLNMAYLYRLQSTNAVQQVDCLVERQRNAYLRQRDIVSLRHDAENGHVGLY